MSECGGPSVGTWQLRNVCRIGGGDVLFRCFRYCGCYDKVVNTLLPELRPIQQAIVLPSGHSCKQPTSNQISNSRMAKGKQVPDAWDDDWESLADQMKEEEPPMSSSQQQEIEKTTKAERLARHVEQQRKLWEAA